MTILTTIFNVLLTLDKLAFGLLFAGWPIWLYVVCHTSLFDEQINKFEEAIEEIKENRKKC